MSDAPLLQVTRLSPQKRALLMLRLSVDAISDCTFTWAPRSKRIPFWFTRMTWPPAVGLPSAPIGPWLDRRPWITLGLAS